YFVNVEINLSERIGHITVHEDYFFEAGEFPTTKGEACAIIALDDVNDDVLRPCHSHEQIRKYITAAIVLTSRLRPTPASHALVFEVDMEILQELREDITG
uniref:Uncharacterized protein n=1 Tax=Globisporangium ultimum (strain ATCC 200006 / CBS 805.95 / DAOM BR144) TaxID=431595 RepID=K3WDG9_GLOUD